MAKRRGNEMTQLIARCRHTGLIIAILFLSSLSSGITSRVAAQDSTKVPAKVSVEQNNAVPQQALPTSLPLSSTPSEVTSAQPAQSSSASMEADMMTAAYAEVANALRRGGTVALTGLQSLPAAFSNSMQSLHEEQTGMKELSLTAAGAIVAGLATSAVFLMAFGRLMPRLGPDRGPLGKALWAGLRLAGDLLAVVIFVVLARNGAHMGMVSGSFGKEVTSSFIHIAMTTAIFASFGRPLFARINGFEPLFDIAKPSWHLKMMVGFGFLSGFTHSSLNLADARGLAPMAVDGWLFLSSTIVTAYLLVWFIVGRRDIANSHSGHVNGWQRITGNLIVNFYIVSTIVIWLLGLLVAGTAQNVLWVRVSGISQIVFILIPILHRGVSGLFQYLAIRREAVYGPGFHSVLLWALRIPFSGAIWLIGIHITVILWQPLLANAGVDASYWLNHLQQFGITIVCSAFVCGFLWKFFETISPVNTVKLPGHEDDGEQKTTSRLSTVLPVVRNLVMGAVLAVALLVVLSSLGVNVAPLLAGFGVLGLAVSFGSQALVKDVVSGIFFLAEDAFRIDEYIDVGKLQGTVEQISLRSVRLRHHNGPVHTVPFGQIAAVTNYSRDWGTIKFELRFDRDADLEMIRKTAKKVGLSLLEEPEFAGDFLIPLKMQGIQEVNENSMVIRFKFTCRPGNPSLIKREGIKRLLAAFKAAGLNLASNAVVVRSDGTAINDAAAASTLSAKAANAP
ncbi:mechanosensitive ion channel [Agrobacterium vitis]|nr:mechanosensitive ion channel [Agrobacterium vitis]MUO70131.1 mechanosensitive ion channel [Agrobacterium vitis]MUO85546.1 mechanosensitive ion channel [Agrobacterium vitis]